MDEVKLTSVKVINELYKKFKNKTIEDEFSLQKLVNRSMHLYINDDDFKQQIQTCKNLIPSGSRL